jgi:hypothetical protein
VPYTILHPEGFSPLPPPKPWSCPIIFIWII